jgi:phage anti-repressor protein
MNELIKIEKNNGIDTVNARELFIFLESKQDFSNWIKTRIKKFGFIENQDYTLVNKIIEQVTGSKHLIDYYLSIEMAKELSMVENNEKGKQARQYFIECEKRLKNNNLNNFVTKDDLKEFAKVIIQETMNNIIPLLQNKSDPKQIKSKKDKITVKEYCEQNNIKDYNLISFYIQVGKKCSQMSRELYRSVEYKKEGEYSVARYDIDIIRHCVDMAKIENEKKRSLFNY